MSSLKKSHLPAATWSIYWDPGAKAWELVWSQQASGVPLAGHARIKNPVDADEDLVLRVVRAITREMESALW